MATADRHAARAVADALVIVENELIALRRLVLGRLSRTSHTDIETRKALRSMLLDLNRLSDGSWGELQDQPPGEL